MTRLDERIAACRDLAYRALVEKRDLDYGLFRAEILGLEDARDGFPSKRFGSASIFHARYQLGHRDGSSLLLVEAQPCST